MMTQMTTVMMTMMILMTQMTMVMMIELRCRHLDPATCALLLSQTCTPTDCFMHIVIMMMFFTMMML